MSYSRQSKAASVAGQLPPRGAALVGPKERPQRGKKKLRPFRKVPGGQSGTIQMWVREPTKPIKICFRRLPQLIVNFHRAALTQSPILAPMADYFSGHGPGFTG